MNCSRGLFASLALCIALSTPVLAEIRYVDVSRATGANDGTSWANAFQGSLGVRNALAIAIAGDQVWVAEGTYFPTLNGDRSQSFMMTDGVGIYGGFVGVETSLGERDPALHETILSGDLAGNDSSGGYGDDSCHVVVRNSTGSGERLDGFTITGGNSDGSDGSPMTGSAVLARWYGDLTIARCVIRGNNGRAVDVASAPTVTVEDSRFEANLGGGLSIHGTEGGNVRRCVFTGNSAAQGSAVFLSDTQDVFVDDCLFFDNDTDDGTIYLWFESYPWIHGCTVAGNRSSQNSGAGISGSWSGGWGGIWNSILYDNSGADGSMGLDDQERTGLPLHNSCVQGGPTSSGNIAVDPQFADAPHGDYRLSPSSPCIDAGNTDPYLLSALDLARAPRRQDVVAIEDTGSGAAPIPDMGAFEFPGGLYSIVCAGDGSLARACPCGNAGDAGRGCGNSVLSLGATLVASGSSHPDTVVLTGEGMTHGVACVFLQGNALSASGIAFGDGVRCVAGALKRLGSKTTSSTGAASYPTAGDTRIATRSAALGDPIPNGATRWYQAWYRDSSAAFCPPPSGAAWNISAGIAVGW